MAINILEPGRTTCDTATVSDTNIAYYLLLAMSLFKAGGAKIGEMFDGKWEGKATFYR